MKKPYFWKARNAWYVKDGKSQIKLGKDKEEAFKKYHQLMSGEIEVGSDVLATEIIGQFLDWSKLKNAENTYKFYVRFLKPFGNSIPRLKLRDLKPYHVERLLDQQDYPTDTTANMAVRAVVRPFNWAAKRGTIKHNPIKRCERPAAETRNVYYTSQQRDDIEALVDQDDPFHDFLVFLRDTGARPQEVRAIEARHFRSADQMVVFPKRESKGKKEERVIILSERPFAIVQRLALKFPGGRLFRNTLGNDWTNFAINCRFQKITEKVGYHVFPYGYRHSWITDTLEAGVDPMTVATLSGHKDLTMIWKVYQKLNLRSQHLRDALEKSTRRA